MVLLLLRQAPVLTHFHSKKLFISQQFSDVAYLVLARLAPYVVANGLMAMAFVDRSWQFNPAVQKIILDAIYTPQDDNLQ